jgi:ADP-ribose pyrophosphatase YjhB (NUDIX family)
MMSALAKIWRALSLPKSIQLAIMRLFQDQFLIGVTGVIFNEKNEVLLFKHTYRQTRWSLPGGYMKGKEHPEEGLEREIEEESGLVVSVDTQLNIRTDRGSSRLDICLIGKYIGGEFRKSAEVSESGFFKFEDLPIIAKSQLLFIQEALSLQTAAPIQIAEKKTSLFPRLSNFFSL